MHDLIAAQDIVKKATEIAEKNHLKRISRIIVRLGKIIEHDEVLSPENLKFNFELVKRNTLAGKAVLTVKPGRGRELSIIEVQGEK